MTVLRRATPERLSAFSDGVFAVLITVLVLELRPPELPTFNALLLRWPRWLSYAVSYLFIAIVWTHHHYLMRNATQRPGTTSRRAPQAAGAAIDRAMENRERSPGGAGRSGSAATTQHHHDSPSSAV